MKGLIAIILCLLLFVPLTNTIIQPVSMPLVNNPLTEKFHPGPFVDLYFNDTDTHSWISINVSVWATDPNFDHYLWTIIYSNFLLSENGSAILSTPYPITWEDITISNNVTYLHRMFEMDGDSFVSYPLGRDDYKWEELSWGTGNYSSFNYSQYDQLILVDLYIGGLDGSFFPVEEHCESAILFKLGPPGIEYINHTEYVNHTDYVPYINWEDMDVTWVLATGLALAGLLLVFIRNKYPKNEPDNQILQLAQNYAIDKSKAFFAK